MGFKRFLKNIVKAAFQESTTDEMKKLNIELQRIATRNTANFIYTSLNTAKALNSRKEIIQYAIEKNTIKDGFIAEFGVYKGNSINLIASLLNDTDTQIYGFDSFEGLPEDWRTNFEKGTFGVNQLPEVPLNVTLIKGWFDQTLPAFVNSHSNKPCSLLHIDCDLYSSTKTIFEHLSGNIVSGTVIVFDEFFNYPGWEYGEYRAFIEYANNANLQYQYIGYNQLDEQVIVKIV